MRFYYKKTIEYKDVPIIFLTALGQQKDRDKGFACGAAAYLTKPVSRESLLDTITKCQNTVI